MAGTLSTFAERLWSASAGLVGEVVPTRAAPLAPAERVLVVAPHPDDEAAGCAGTILLHRRLGDAVRIVACTDGRASRAIPGAPSVVAARRREEAEEGVRRLGADLTWLGFPELEWRPESLVAPLARLIDAERPRVIYAPSRVDLHPEHLHVARALATALSTQLADDPGGSRAGEARPARLRSAPPHSPPIVRIYQVQVVLTPLLVNLAVDTSPVDGEIAGVLAAHASQLGSIERTLRLRRYAARLHGAALSAEVFWELSAEAYCLLHEEHVGAWIDSPFAGVKSGAASDVLAFARGLAARLDLKRRSRPFSSRPTRPAPPRRP